jgi:hypothetical protein
MSTGAKVGALGVLSVLLVAGASDAATQRKVQGIITDVESGSVTITPGQGRATVTGQVDAKKTRIVLDGHSARVADLKVTYKAKGDLGLDDVWVTLVAGSAR